MTFHVFTVATKNHPGLEYLLHSMDQWDLPPLVIKSMLNKKFQKWGQGFGVKMQELTKFLKPLPPNDIVLMVDAYDLYLIGGEKEIMKRYNKFKTPIVISAEPACNEDANCVGSVGRVTDSESTHKFLCSGAIIGRVGALKYVLEKNPFDTAKDDQVYWGELWAKHKDLIVIDSRSELFASMAWARSDYEFKRENGKPVAIRKDYNTRPVVIHYNGPMVGFSETFYKFYPEAQDNNYIYAPYGKFHYIVRNWVLLAMLFLMVILIVRNKKFTIFAVGGFLLIFTMVQIGMLIYPKFF